MIGIPNLIGSRWDVASIEGGSVRQPWDVWVFSDGDGRTFGTVEAANGSWRANWKATSFENMMDCITFKGSPASWKLTFINPIMFVATQESNGHFTLFRFGKVIGEGY